jgi:4-diphosphocytidyl-2-C-methyl-D-erythritol kinase
VTVLSAKAPAKVNLALAITGRREDGYHLLRSVFVGLALHDILEVEVDPSVRRDALRIDGPMRVSDDDLVLRAASRLRAAIDPSLPALRFRLLKRIPIAAGLGGGSSDAAAALDLALEAWGVRHHAPGRLEVALRLGADVPFFAAGHEASLVEGIGEDLERLPAPSPPAGLLLITPAQRLSTAEVFAELDRLPTAPSAATERVDDVATLLRAEVDGGALAAAAARLPEANDLWAPASRLSAQLAPAREAATELLGRAVMLSGSGPTLFAVYPSEAEATQAAVALQAECPEALEGAAIMTTSTRGGGGDP